jgi:hypothetical protein
MFAVFSRAQITSSETPKALIIVIHIELCEAMELPPGLYGEVGDLFYNYQI